MSDHEGREARKEMTTATYDHTKQRLSDLLASRVRECRVTTTPRMRCENCDEVDDCRIVRTERFDGDLWMPLCATCEAQIFEDGVADDEDTIIATYEVPQ